MPKKKKVDVLKSRVHDALTYGEFGEIETDELSIMREMLMDYLEKGKSNVYKNMLHALMEVERELTLRESE